MLIITAKKEQHLSIEEATNIIYEMVRIENNIEKIIKVSLEGTEMLQRITTAEKIYKYNFNGYLKKNTKISFK